MKGIGGFFIDMPNPNDLSSYDEMENPFAAILGGGAGPQPQAQPAPQQGAAPGGAPAAQAAPQGGAEGQGVGPDGKPIEDQLAKGQNPGSTKFLLTAIQSLENYIKESEDRDEVATARSIISIISRLIDRDQSSMVGQI